jgi:hypothetical protein
MLGAVYSPLYILNCMALAAIGWFLRQYYLLPIGFCIEPLSFFFYSLFPFYHSFPSFCANLIESHFSLVKETSRSVLQKIKFLI